MAIRAETFIALEGALAGRLQASLGKLLAPTYREVEAALSKGEYDAARTKVKAINIDALFADNEDFILLVSRMAAVFGASRVTRSPGTSLVGMGFERTTIEMASQSFRLALRQNVQEALIEAGLQSIAAREGKPVAKDDDYLVLVHKAKKASALLPFASFMDSQGKAFLNIASSLHTSRLSSFGFVAEAEYLGHTYYQINEQLDGRTCLVCSTMHRKMFRVSDARALLDIVVRTQDPDELKTLQPWPSQSASSLKEMANLSPENLVSRGWHVPPFHPRCRGLLAPAGKVPKLQSPKATQTAPDATQADFEHLGLKLSPAKVTLWNELMHSPPSSVLSQLMGTTPDEMLQAALVGQQEPPYKVSVSKAGVRVVLDGPAHGSSQSMHQEYLFRSSLDAFIGSVEVPTGKFDLIRKALKALYYTAKNSFMKRMAMIAEAGSDGYVMSRMGFASSADQWVKIKAAILGSKEKQALITSAPPVEQKALGLILSSPDPANVYALADLPTLGKALMADIPWAGYMALDSTEAVTRFAASMGAKL